MLAREQIHDFAEGTLERPVRAALEIGGQALNVALTAMGNRVQAVVIPGGNNPAVEAAVTRQFDEAAAEGTWGNYQFTLRFLDGFRNRESLVGSLRAAYLVAFALFGYRYVLRPALRGIREMFATGEETGPSVFHMTIEGATKDERRIMMLERPFQSLFVQIGRHGVFLPRPDVQEDGGLYDSLAVRAGQSHSDSFSGDLIRWPELPMYALDRT
jgi:hypothetical protein